MLAMFFFYNEAQGKQLKWVQHEEFKHCRVIIYGGDNFILFESSRYGIDHQVIKSNSAERIWRNMRVIKSLTHSICVYVNRKHEFPWRPLWVRSCNEVCRYLSSVDIGFTLTPYGLFKKLLKYDKTSNYEVLAVWRRHDGVLE